MGAAKSSQRPRLSPSVPAVEGMAGMMGERKGEQEGESEVEGLASSYTK